jgi:uncharacterized membrane protein
MTVGSPPRAAPAGPPEARPRPPGDLGRRADWAVAGMALVAAVVLSWLSVARHRAFWTGRFDLGNMVQAVWSTAHGRPLETTDAAGRQFSRLGAHVDPLLAALAPLWAVWPRPEMLLVVQAVAVSLGALPAFWLGRRWLGDDRLAMAAAAVYLLYPPVAWATVTEFHPVTLAAPLLMYAIWAAETGRTWHLAVFAALALLAKEQVGLALVMLGVWMAVRGRRRAGAILAAVSAAWVAFAVLVVIPHYNGGRGSAFLARYGEAGDGPGDIARAFLTRPWEVVTTLGDPGRLGYLAALLVPLLLLSLAAPLLAAGALPDLVLNLLADWWPQQSIEYQYGAVIAPFLVASAILGLARMRARRRPALLARALASPAHVAAGAVLVMLASLVLMGPLPVPSAVSIASESRLAQYERGPHARVLDEAVALVPEGAPVSAGNLIAAHLSDRRRIMTFPEIDEAEWVLVDERRPYVADRLSAPDHALRLAALRARADFRQVFARDGVLVFRRVGP